MAARPTADAPLLLIVAGPNGSGKSTAYEETLPEFQGRTVWIVNPDRLTRRLTSVENLAGRDANLAAVVRIEEWLYASFQVHQSVGVETVLSTGKYRSLVTRAKELGYEVWLLYVILDHPDKDVERVAIRVRKVVMGLMKPTSADATTAHFNNCRGSSKKRIVRGFMTTRAQSFAWSVRKMRIRSNWTSMHLNVF